MANGGIIGVVNTPTQLAASGVWTLQEQFLARVANIWPAAGVPSVVLNAAVWLDAADATTITESGGDVSQWNNKGTLGNFTQGTGALQPKTGVTTLNGRNVLDFAGDFVVSADPASSFKFMHDGTTYMLLAVVKFGTTSDPNTFYGIAGTFGGSGTGVGCLHLFDDRASLSRNNTLTTAIYRGVDNSFAVLGPTANGFYAANTFGIATWVLDPDNGTAANRLELYANGGSASKPNTQTNAVSASNPNDTLSIGTGHSTTTAPLTGSIAELVIVSGADATDSNRQIIRDYLNEKWAVY